MPGFRQTYPGYKMFVRTLKIVFHLLCLLHLVTMPLAAALPTEHRKPQLNDTTIARLPEELQLYETQDRHRIHYYMTYACEREELQISCDNDFSILIVRANYGRHSTRPCTKTTKKRNIICPGSFVHPKKVLARTCTGSRSCKLPVISRLFGDPCPKVSKYLEVYFGCIRDEIPESGEH